MAQPSRYFQLPNACPRSRPQLRFPLPIWAERVQIAHPHVERFGGHHQARSPSIVRGRHAAGADIDPVTGRGIASADPNPLERWLTNLHRSLFLGDGGRIAAAAGPQPCWCWPCPAPVLVARRAGGWRAGSRRCAGPLPARLHVEIARRGRRRPAAVLGDRPVDDRSTFELLPDGPASPAMQDPIRAAVPAHRLQNDEYPEGDAGMRIAQPGISPHLATRQMSLPSRPIALPATLDQGTGALLAWSDLTGWQRVSETIYMLHTDKAPPDWGSFSA